MAIWLIVFLSAVVKVHVMTGVAYQIDESNSFPISLVNYAPITFETLTI